MTIRLDGRLQSPSFSVFEELERDFGPKRRGVGAADPRTEHRKAWTEKDEADDARRVKLAAIIAERERVGMERHGEPLDPFELQRWWVPETLDELAGAAAYATCEMRLLEPEKRCDADAKYRWQRVREARRLVEKAMLILIEAEERG